MKNKFFFFGMAALAMAGLLGGCEKVIVTPVEEEDSSSQPAVLLEDVARLLSVLPLESEQLEEVYDAARASATNGYDEEYRMQELFSEPGAGVGDKASTKADGYRRPLRELLREAALSTKADGILEDPEAWLEALESSDVQIYWPFSEAWDGDSFPVVTFDPGGDVGSNEGYSLGPDGKVTKVLVTEEMAQEQPVWVVNRNSDAEYKTLEMLRREDPSWGQGAGDLVVSKADTDIKTLVLRTFKAKRQFDSWFAGASEFWVKIGAVEDFTASTEAELRLYEPSITDFLMVVRRAEVGQDLTFNAVLVSEWTQQLSSAALMIVEDDGGTQTSWKCSATVKYNSKSYGFDIDIPLRTRDDIVWRGNLTRSYIEKYNGQQVGLGDVELVLELI
ncbi:MAG: hypothetical protein IJ753_09540 [Bacteroidales bacterium]|nr:hypothetical protein [Bacteroidales bacterium]MBR1783741.1 hypothetical protein [Bacteroidales bacterium]